MHSITTEHTARTEAQPRTAPMSNQAAIKLVDLLATSDEFRNVFMRDARMALETWQFDQQTIDDFWWDCKIGITQLAPKEVIGAARDEIVAMLMSALAQTTPKLDSGLEGQWRLRQ
jgi:putative modified peptide